MNIVIDPSINSVSHAIGAITYFGLAFYLLKSIKANTSGRLILLAALIMGTWNFVIALDSFFINIDLSYFSNILEIIKVGSCVAVCIFDVFLIF